MGVCFKGFQNIAKLLIDKGADVNVANYNGATALIFAAIFNRIELVKLLLDSGANPELRDDCENRALEHAQMQNASDIVALLSS